MQMLGQLLCKEEQSWVLAFDKEGKRDKTSTGFGGAKGWACQCVPEGKGLAARIRKTPVLLTLALTSPATTHNQQTLPLLGGGGRVVVALSGIVPRKKNVGVGNHIKGLGLFKNLYTSDHQTRVQ